MLQKADKYDKKKTITTCKIITKSPSDNFQKYKKLKTDFVGILISARNKFPQNHLLKKIVKIIIKNQKMSNNKWKNDKNDHNKWS